MHGTGRGDTMTVGTQGGGSPGTGVHVVQLANFVAPRSGGIRTTLEHLARGYAAAGLRVTQVVPGPADAVEEHPWGVRRVLRGPGVPGNPYRVLLSRRRIAALLRDLAPDRVEVHDRTTLRWVGPWARRAGVPSMVISHERLDRVLRGWLPWLPGAVADAVADQTNLGLARTFTHVMCTTGWAGAEFARLAVPTLKVVPLGVDLGAFAVPAPRPGDDGAGSGAGGGSGAGAAGEVPGPGVMRLVMASRLSPEKRPDLAVDAVRLLTARGRAVHLTVAGDGPLRDRLERTATREGLPVRFVGHLADRAELAGLYARADVLVAPGPAETFGLAALEALACGTPVVANADSALPEVLGRAGLAAEPTAHGFAQALAHAADRIEAGSWPGSSPRARAERFTWDRTVAGFMAVHGVHGEHGVHGAHGEPATVDLRDPAGLGTAV